MAYSVLCLYPVSTGVIFRSVERVLFVNEACTFK